MQERRPKVVSGERETFLSCVADRTNNNETVDARQ